MSLCEKCIHRDVCADRDCMDADDERALQSCNDFKNKADFVEVVRCKDCKYGTIAYGCLNTKKGLRGEFVKLTDFCSRGERRDT